LESSVKITYVDATWTVRIVEISDLDFCIAYELVEAEPHAEIISVCNTLRCQRISDSHETFFLWSTQFSSDVTVNVLMDNKLKKRDAF
jgi:hypothetical protein